MYQKNFSVWPANKPHELPLPETTNYDNFVKSLERFPDKNAIVFYETGITYREMADDVKAIGGWMQQKGVRQGDRIGIMTQNCPQFMIAYFGALSIGAAVVPVSPMLVEEELEYIVDNASLKVLFAAVNLYHSFTGIMDRRDIQVVGVQYSDYLKVETSLTVPDFIRESHYPADICDRENMTLWQMVLDKNLASEAVDLQMTDLVVLPYTSGSTGNPKGCVHNNISTQHATQALANWFDVQADDTSLLVAPMFHVIGLQCGINAMILKGGTVVILPRWDREVAAHAIDRYKVTLFPTVPAMLIDLLNMPNLDDYDISSLRRVFGGGASMPEAVAHKLQSMLGLTFLEGYGLTETCCPATNNPSSAPKAQCGGIPTFNTLVRIIDIETLEELELGQTGEIVVHGPQNMQGYWNNPEATEASFITIDGLSYLRTGDLGYTDEQGYFYIVDRLKRMINASGYKVWPTQVENVLYRHPGIAEACVIGTTDPKRGETVKALVVRAHNAPDLSEDEIIEWSREHMASYKIPRIITFVNSLPKTASGKVLWRQLQDEENAAMEKSA